MSRAEPLRAAASQRRRNTLERAHRASWTARARRSASRASRVALASRGNGSTAKPSCAARSNASAVKTRRLPHFACPTRSAPARTRCASATRCCSRRTSGCARRIPRCATNSQSSTASAATRSATNRLRNSRDHELALDEGGGCSSVGSSTHTNQPDFHPCAPSSARVDV